MQEEENKASIWEERKFRKYGYIDNDQNEDDQERERGSRLVKRRKKKITSLK